VAAQGADAPRYLGCFKDQGATDGVEGRDLDGAMSSDGAMTSAVCIEECRAQGFAYAGTQYSSYCFCGNRYGASGPADNCNTPCAGKPEEICGGGWANSVYATGIDRSVAGRVIRVQTASYGQDCGAAAANVTDHAKQTCDGKRDCEYRVDYTLIGDPAPGCAKDYVIGWTCGAHQKVSYLSAAPEAGLGSVLRLSCPPPKGALTGPAPVAVTATGGSGVIRERTQPVVVTRQATGGSSTLTVPNEPVARRQRPLVRTAANDGSGTRMAALAANLDQAQLAIDDLVAQNRELDMKLQAIEARLATAEAQLDLRLAESARSIARDALRYASDYGRDVFKLHSLEQAELQARELSARSPDYRKLLKAVQAQSARRHQAAEENFARYAQAVAKLSEIGDARRQQALNDLEASGLNEQAQAALGLIRDQLAQYVHSRRADPGRWKLAFKQRFETAAE
jgi:hypothetical protein